MGVRTAYALLTALALTLLGAPRAGAIDYVIPTKVLLEKGASKNKIVAKGTFVLPDPNDDPTVAGGKIRFRVLDGDPNCDVIFMLDSSTWTTIGSSTAPKGFKSRNGGCKIVIVKTNVIKALCPPYTPACPQITNTEVLSTVLTLGDTTNYCSQCDGTTKGNPARLIKRKDCPAPGGCPIPTRCCEFGPFAACYNILDGGTCSGGSTLEGFGLVCNAVTGKCEATDAGTSDCCQATGYCFEGPQALGIPCLAGTEHAGESCGVDGMCAP